MNDAPQDRVPVQRHRIGSFRIYEIQGADFDRIETEASSIGTDLTFATFAGSCFLTLLVTLNTVEIKDERLHSEFFIIACVCLAVTIICGVRWLRQRGALTKLLKSIRDQLVDPGPLGDQTNPLGKEALSGLPVVAAPTATIRKSETGGIELAITETIQNTGDAVSEPSPLVQPTSKTEPSAKP